MAQALREIVDEIEGVALEASRRLPPNVLAELLAFLTKVSQVLDQAYRDVIPILIDVKHLDEGALHGPQIKEILKKIDLVMAISRYRDAEEICSRLAALRTTYQTELAQHVDPEHRYEWSGLLGLIEEREGRIVQLIRSNLYELQSALDHPSVRDVSAIRQMASEQMEEVTRSLKELNRFASSILGLSGSTGLLEMLRDPNAGPAVTRKLSLIINRNPIMGDQHNYHTSGDQSPIIGAGAQTGDISISQSGTPIDLPRLADELAELRREMRARATGAAEEDVALGEVAKAEAAARADDERKALRALKAAGKWAFGVAEKIGVGVAVAAMKPLVGG
jgi:hypothetical protein